MSRRPRRNHSAIFKAKVAVDAIRGEKTASKEACAALRYLRVNGIFSAKAGH